jgi:acyl-CoA synthetase (NDP forming)
VAIVGIGDDSLFASSAERSLRSDAEIFFVHPRHRSAFGRATYPDLVALGRPVDAVFSVVSAERTVEVVQQAAQIGAGGVITIAAGFAEVGPVGAALQDRMLDAARAGNLPVIGPNGVGLINVPRQLDLTMLGVFDRRVGGLSAVTHSGAMIEAMAASAWRAGGVGFNLLISAGNEAVTDVADFLDYLADDPMTKVIALAVEKIRRPDVFFAAAHRCLEAGKPIVAMKMGKGERAQRMAASHTGTLTTDAWVYDVAFRQAGIQPAHDIDDLIDRVQFLEQLSREHWSPVTGLAVLTMTGGFAQLSSDLAEEEHVDVPEATGLRAWLAEAVPGGTVPNPLDATGFAGSREGMWAEIVDKYAGADDFDILLYTSQHAEWDTRAEPFVETFVAGGRRRNIPMIVGPLAGNPGSWLDSFRSADVAIGNGLRGCFRGLHTMGAFMRTRPDARVPDPASVPPVPRPADWIDADAGRMLTFSATMELLSAAGISVAPYQLVEDGRDWEGPVFGGPYVVKLADVAHRTDHGAVQVTVSDREVAAAIARLRALAADHGLPPLVAIQPMLSGHGEAFIGIQGSSELGPLVVFGIGGVFVEALREVRGRLAPLTEQDAGDLLDEFAATGMIDGFRGGQPWDRPALVAALVSAGRLGAGGRAWIESIDINPLIITPGGPVAVDGLCLLRAGA